MKQEPTFRWDQNLKGTAREIAALDHTPIRVLAGPGTGKTYAMMRRVARLLQEGSTPDRILVCTFTRTAAGDLSRELSNLGVDGVNKVQSETLHAFCFRLLRKSEVFEITKRIARPLLPFEERFLLKDLNHESFGDISERKRRLSAFNAAWARLQHEEPGWAINPVDRTYEQDLKEWLQFHESILIGELVPETLRFLRQNPSSTHRGVFEHVLIDEYQDLNKAEQTLLDLLAERGQLFVIGDEDQSIYSFKFAHPEGIADFSRSHPGTHDLELNECRRCPRRVVKLANTLISENRRKKSRKLNIRPENPDGEVLVLQWKNIEEETQGIAKIIHSRIHNREVESGQVLVLSPRRQFGDLVRDHLRASGIRAHSFFQEKALKNKDAQQAFTLLTLMANSENRVALRCWCGFGSGNLRHSSWKRLWNHCNTSGETPRMALERLISGELNIPYTNHLVKPYQDLQSRLKELENVHGQALVDAIFPDDKDWAHYFRDLASKIEESQLDANKLYEFLRTSISQPELPTDVDYVRVMSLHKSKGLTARMVVLVGCIEGLIPASPDIKRASEERQTDLMDEQRRLFYVAITRCTQSLILSSVTHLPQNMAHEMKLDVRNTNRNYVPTITSRFVHELGPTRPNPIPGSVFLEEMGL